MIGSRNVDMSLDFSLFWLDIYPFTVSASRTAQLEDSGLDAHFERSIHVV
jgi:hypothetical protein